VLPPGELNGAVTWRNQCHDRATLHGVIIPSAILKIVFRHFFYFSGFSMQFGLWRAAAFVSSPIHLLHIKYKGNVLRTVDVLEITFVVAFRFLLPVGIYYSSLPRDVMLKRVLCRHAVCVCVSVTFVHCVKTNKDIFELFHFRAATPL